MENTVIVLDLGNYNERFREEVPFKAVIWENLETEIWVRSLSTDRLWEVYPNQILEFNEIETIKRIINLKEWY